MSNNLQMLCYKKEADYKYILSLFEKCTYLSNVAAKIYFPFGEKRTKDTGGFSSSKNSKKREWNMDVYKDVPKK